MHSVYGFFSRKQIDFDLKYLLQFSPYKSLHQMPQVFQNSVLVPSSYKDRFLSVDFQYSPCILSKLQFYPAFYTNTLFKPFYIYILALSIFC
jgi:hypothetical protein